MNRAVYVSNAPLRDVPTVHVMSLGWRRTRAIVLNSRAYIKGDGASMMTVIVTVERYSDGSRWLHVSCARPSRAPDYDDLCAAWRLFGDALEGLQKWVRPEEHVSLHPFCLHLWGRMDGVSVTPDFRRLSDGAAGV